LIRLLPLVAVGRFEQPEILRGEETPFRLRLRSTDALAGLVE
jgi:hypothetical protein